MKLTYTVVYVSDLLKSIQFYERAFGLKSRFIHESGQYAEMETGATTLAFASNELARSIIKDGYQQNLPDALPAGMQISFEPVDMQKAYDNAIAAGATKVSPPELKPWGWMSAFIRDPDGILVELAQEVK